MLCPHCFPPTATCSASGQSTGTATANCSVSSGPGPSTSNPATTGHDNKCSAIAYPIGTAGGNIPSTGTAHCSTDQNVPAGGTGGTGGTCSVTASGPPPGPGQPYPVPPNTACSAIPHQTTSGTVTPPPAGFSCSASAPGSTAGGPNTTCSVIYNGTLVTPPVITLPNHPSFCGDPDYHGHHNPPPLPPAP